MITVIIKVNDLLAFVADVLFLYSLVPLYSFMW